MRIGGIQRFTLIDFPGKVACIVFTQGCNFRCPYCYNRSLVLPEYFEEPIPEDVFFRFLRSRRGLLDGVVITGGEPTVQEDLLNFMENIKSMGFLVKLDTNGSHPEVVKEVIERELVDYIAMDVKAPLRKYKEVIRVEDFDVGNIVRSIHLLMDSGVDYEFRTTVVREQLTPEDILEIGKLIKGAKRYALQKFVVTDTLLNPSFKEKHTYTEEELERIAEGLREYIEEVKVR
ncbi:pyruvate formate lyase activating enzyme [Hydrogenivirga caldilitoris]|uniref:Pyruvate formate lyase activating enzyme n=1 Tax=Hydrogenivirga caldilitoris TaxID=246264 RepID=A0A497XTR5_9AQUI|nr:anaerobic ribonucleoside-triphosphate reductase activating protein [Hydrogenivirga caldilitoris]RLJ70313.1 pyruvate formate lyase activating enzyme [Hydrogenivirga caldilitoris]